MSEKDPRASVLPGDCRGTREGAARARLRAAGIAGASPGRVWAVQGGQDRRPGPENMTGAKFIPREVAGPMAIEAALRQQESPHGAREPGDHVPRVRVAAV